MSLTKSLLKRYSEALPRRLETMKAIHLSSMYSMLTCGATRKKRNIIGINRKHNRARSGASTKSSFSRALFPLDVFSLPSETSKFWRHNFVWKLAWYRTQMGSVVWPIEWSCTLCRHHHIFSILAFPWWHHTQLVDWWRRGWRNHSFPVRPPGDLRFYQGSKCIIGFALHQSVTRANSW